ncbi:MAG: hypothetical protein Q8N63_08920 [Nanoarchaeota archaeon]|nr:hypothetical protein [Nanoarchaeota archaeon]
MEINIKEICILALGILLIMTGVYYLSHLSGFGVVLLIAGIIIIFSFIAQLRQRQKNENKLTVYILFLAIGFIVLFLPTFLKYLYILIIFIVLIIYFFIKKKQSR